MHILDGRELRVRLAIAMGNWAAAGVVVLALEVVSVDGATPAAVPSSGETSACRLKQPGADATLSRDCLACHAATGRDSHPVDVDYERARARVGGGRLRPLEEVVRRGVFVPDGEIRCVTCHDGESPWKYRLALPPGATARPAVKAGDPATYDRREPAMPPGAGTAVMQKPLCTTCHALD